jgi:glycosyltransferase involved in cell wall biosynthesis
VTESWLPARPALFPSSFHPHLGGVEELVRQLAHAQQRAGAQPVVHTMRWPRDLAAREQWDGIDIRRHSYRVPEGSLRRVVPAAVANPVVLGDVVGQLRGDRAELVHVQCVSSGAWFAYQAARVVRLPIVVTLQGELTMDADHVYEKSPLLRRTLRTLLARADAVTACSRATLTEAEEWAGIALGARGRVVPNGVDLGEFADAAVDLGARKPSVVALGRMVPQKGFDVLVDAFGELTRDPTFSWDLELAGDGPELGALRTRAATGGVDDRIRFVGRVDRAEAVELLAGASAFVLPSRHEPFGIVNLEAMAAGTPVVATRVGGVPEIVDDGITGLLVDARDPASLARAIRSLHDDAALRTRVATAASQHVVQFGWAAVEQQYREVYASARAARRGA